jgi:nitrite reductase (NADH) large subunit
MSARGTVNPPRSTILHIAQRREEGIKMRKNLIVIGNGMVGHKFLDRLCEAGLDHEWNITTFCEEPRPAYDRVGMSGFFAGKNADDLMLATDTFFDE